MTTTEPQRTCVGCRRRRAAGELIRLGLGPDRRPYVGPGPGRGAWLCHDTADACGASARRRRAFDRAFKQPVGGSVVDELVTLAGQISRRGGLGPTR